jgi:hypothetical protein
MVEKKVPLIQAVKTKQKDVFLDPKGFFVIEVHQKEIRVEYYSNVYKQGKIVSGVIQKIFVGKRADELCDTIAHYVPFLLPAHYLYLGRELQKAQTAFEKKTTYVQGGC